MIVFYEPTSNDSASGYYTVTITGLTGTQIEQLYNHELINRSLFFGNKFTGRAHVTLEPCYVHMYGGPEHVVDLLREEIGVPYKPLDSEIAMFLDSITELLEDDF